MLHQINHQGSDRYFDFGVNSAAVIGIELTTAWADITSTAHQRTWIAPEISTEIGQ
jgi:hypothetical protein